MTAARSEKKRKPREWDLCWSSEWKGWFVDARPSTCPDSDTHIHVREVLPEKAQGSEGQRTPEDIAAELAGNCCCGGDYCDGSAPGASHDGTEEIAAAITHERSLLAVAEARAEKAEKEYNYIERASLRDEDTIEGLHERLKEAVGLLRDVLTHALDAPTHDRARAFLAAATKEKDTTPDPNERFEYREEE